MFHLSNTERIEAKSATLRVLQANSDRLFGGRSSSGKADKASALSALMAIERAPGLSQSVGPRDLNRLLWGIRNDEFPLGGYRALSDTIARSFGASTMGSSERTHRAISPFRDGADFGMGLFSGQHRHVRNQVTFGTIPPTLPGPSKYGLGTSPPGYGGVAMEGGSGIRWRSPQTPSFHSRGSVGFPGFDLPIVRGEVSETDVAAEYGAFLREWGDPQDFEILSQLRRREAIRLAGVFPRDVLRFLNIGDQSNTIRAFAGPMRSTASGMQSYLNFCCFAGRAAPPVQTDTVLLRSILFRPGRTFAQ